MQTRFPCANGREAKGWIGPWGRLRAHLSGRNSSGRWKYFGLREVCLFRLYAVVCGKQQLKI